MTVFSDFGFCLDLGDSGDADESVKFGVHVAPEKKYSEKSDVFSLGVVLFEIISLDDLSHDTLYQHNTTTLVNDRKAVATEVKQLTTQYGDMVAVIQSMLLDDPDKRWSASQAHDAFAALLSKIPVAGRGCVFLRFMASLHVSQNGARVVLLRFSRIALQCNGFCCSFCNQIF